MKIKFTLLFLLLSFGISAFPQLKNRNTNSEIPASGITKTGYEPQKAKLLGPGNAYNQYPANGADWVELGLYLNWYNPSAATSIELFFGPDSGNLTSIYSGAPITSFSPGSLELFTTYFWRINETDASGTTTGSLWNFTTMVDPNLLPKYYPQSIDYWTGTTDGSTKTDASEVRTIDPEMGWMVFDISELIPYAQIISVGFWGYVNATYYPYWSVTPMGTCDPVNDDVAIITAQLMSGYDLGTAYVYSNENSTFAPGWHNYMLETTAVPDLQSAINANRGWFALGFVDRDFSTTFYINFDGWAQSNIPYLTIEYCVGMIPDPPSNLNAVCSQPQRVDLTWQFNTTYEYGFQIIRKLGNSSAASQWDFLANLNSNITSWTDTTVLDTTVYSYKILAYGCGGHTNFSNIATVMTIIPVELISFNADCSDGKVLLSWSTSTETNNKGFEVQRSDGHKSDWKVIGFVEGNGTTTEQHTYSFVDSKIQSGRYQYRLKQIDFNGSFTWSPVVEVDAEFPQEFSLYQNYPNPFNPVTKIRYQLPEDNLITIKVYNTIGEEVVTLVNEFKTVGSYETKFNGSTLPTGIYIYKMVSGSYTSVRKMLLLK